MSSLSQEQLDHNGVVVGNFYDKYNTKNPLAKFLMKNFHNKLLQAVESLPPVKTCIEIGCGEGYLMQFLQERLNLDLVKGYDISESVLDIARKLLPNVPFENRPIEKITSLEGDIGICCEVLEHILNPEIQLARLSQFNVKYWIFSVPNEPIWRILNMARGAYLLKLGNTPGHINHWSPTAFHKMVGRHFKIIKKFSPFPWTLVVCEKK